MPAAQQNVYFSCVCVCTFTYVCISKIQIWARFFILGMDLTQGQQFNLGRTNRGQDICLLFWNRFYIAQRSLP